MIAAVESPTRVLAISADEYHARNEISRSQLSDFLESRWLFYQRHVLKSPLYQFEPTAETKLGTWWHEFVLERGASLNDMGLVVIPSDVLSAAGHRRGKKYDEWESQHPTDAIVTTMEMQQRVEMLQSIKRNTMANALLIEPQDDAENEVTITWMDEVTGIGLRARLDRVIAGQAIVDLKTITNADHWSIRREIRDRRYHVQGGMYQEAQFQATGQRLPFVLVFLEKSCPWRCVVRQIPQKGLDQGYQLAMQALRDIQDCQRTGDWHDPETKSDEVPLADDPMWEEA